MNVSQRLGSIEHLANDVAMSGTACFEGKRLFFSFPREFAGFFCEVSHGFIAFFSIFFHERDAHAPKTLRNDCMPHFTTTLRLVPSL